MRYVGTGYNVKVNGECGFCGDVLGHRPVGHDDPCHLAGVVREYHLKRYNIARFRLLEGMP